MLHLTRLWVLGPTNSSSGPVSIGLQRAAANAVGCSCLCTAANYSRVGLLTPPYDSTSSVKPTTQIPQHVLHAILHHSGPGKYPRPVPDYLESSRRSVTAHKLTRRTSTRRTNRPIKTPRRPRGSGSGCPRMVGMLASNFGNFDFSPLCPRR